MARRDAANAASLPRHRRRHAQVPLSRPFAQRGRRRSSGATAPGGTTGAARTRATATIEFRREVDYGSAAALMVRASFWREVGRLRRALRADVLRGRRPLLRGARARAAGHVRAARHTSSTSRARRPGPTSPPATSATRRSTGRSSSRSGGAARAEQLPPDTRNLRGASNRGAGPRVLIIDHRVPMWDRDAGSLRMRAMIEALIALGCRVTFLPDDLQPRQPYTDELQQIGVPRSCYGPSTSSASWQRSGPSWRSSSAPVRTRRAGGST